MKLKLATCLLPLLFAATADAATWYSQGSGDLSPNQYWRWNATRDGGADFVNGLDGLMPPAEGNTDTWVIQAQPEWNRARLNLTDTTWYGGTTVFEGARNPERPAMFFLNNGATATVQDAIFDGGAINSNGGTMYGNTATVMANGVTIGIEGGSSIVVDFNAIVGAGPIRIQTLFDGALVPPPGGSTGTVQLAAGTDLSGYAGTIVMTGNQKFALGGNVTTPTFGIESQSAGSQAYVLQNNVTVTSAVFGTTALDPGTYNATDLTNLGLGDYFTNNGGTLTVEPAVIVPQNLVAVPGNNQVTLNWSAFPGATGYSVKRSLTAYGPFTDAVFPTGPVTTYTDTTAVNGMTYYYAVSATTTAGETGNSLEVRALPNVPFPTVNLDFGNQGVYTGEGPAGPRGGTVWNEFNAGGGTLSGLLDSAGNGTAVSVTVSNFNGTFGFGAGSTQLWADYNLLSDNPNDSEERTATVVFENLAANSWYDLYLLGLGGAPDQTAKFTLAAANGGASGITRGPFPAGEFGAPNNFIVLSGYTDANGRLEYAVDNSDSPDTGHNAVQLVAAFEMDLSVERNGDNLDFAWTSKNGKQYDLVSDTSLDTPPADWPVWDGREDMAPTGDFTTILNVPDGGDARRFFVMVEKDPLPDYGVDPSLVELYGSGVTITLVFSQSMQPGAATDPANYSVMKAGGGAVTISSVAISSNGKTVTLTAAAPLDLTSSYTVTMNNLADLGGRPLAPATMGNFGTWDNNPNGVKVFILAGQSNMVGYGETEIGNGGINGAVGSLRYLAVNDASYPEYTYSGLLVDPGNPATSAWATRSDVKVWWDRAEPGYGPNVIKGDLTVGFGAQGNKIGPEYAFGQVLGDYYGDPDDKVLLIKTAWGGKSLREQFRPPSAVAARGGTVGPFYTGMLNQVRDVLEDLDTEFPAWAGLGYQVVGFGWHQGYNDRIDQAAQEEYEANLVDLINDLRVEFGNPSLPISIATTGMEPDNFPGYSLVELAQLAVGDPDDHPEFDGTVFSVDARPFWRLSSVSPNDQGFHWNFNAESYFLIGKAMGEGMTGLLGE
ncbi:sialate O-acetylesterase [Haloferula sp. A504]|uniref:sialate O-acetylesterase n=1 Tax=Haloferula sp. A504 TaxID=3373601 RepID=UPI0031C32FF7|nr:Ig-like domain-containing protein [Verrucomicrobiaceae bacterium E54]